MTGADVRGAREALGWSRPELSKRTGLTVAQLARIEHPASGTLRPDDEAKIRPVLKNALAGVLVAGSVDVAVQLASPAPEGRPGTTQHAPEGASELRAVPAEAVTDPWDDGTVTETSWRGLEPGTTIKLANDPHPNARYEFRHYFHSASQEYVALTSRRNRMQRTVRPERILVQRRGKWVAP